MEKLAISLWGWYFGTTVIMLAGLVLAYSRSLRRVSLNTGLAVFASLFFVIAFLGGLPISNDDLQARFLAHLQTAVAALLSFLLLSILGFLKHKVHRQKVMLILGSLCVIVNSVGWLLAPRQALALSSIAACLLTLIALFICIKKAQGGDRLALISVFSVFFLSVALVGLSWIALNRLHVSWLVHAVSALSATLYICMMSWIVWARYAYLIELHEAMTHGPAYDPVTRMRSHSETGQLVGEVFKRFHDVPAPLGLIVLTIANLQAIEKLYGVAAVNSALFICANRLRRVVTEKVEMGRLGNDGFLLVMTNCQDSGRLKHVARALEPRLRKSVTLNTSLSKPWMETKETYWVGEIGIGVMVVSRPTARGPSAIAMAKGLSRTAMSYPSRIAWFEQSSGGIVELPALGST
jgi:GGDEF domain-containing protein